MSQVRILSSRLTENLGNQRLSRFFIFIPISSRNRIRPKSSIKITHFAYLQTKCLQLVCTYKGLYKQKKLPAISRQLFLYRFVKLLLLRDCVCTACVLLGLGCTGKSYRCSCTLGDCKLPSPAIALILPRTLDKASSRVVLGIHIT